MRLQSVRERSPAACEGDVLSEIRVEVALIDPDEHAMSVIHGIQGAVEVEIERITPAVWLLRAVGSWLTSPLPKPSPEGGG